jgi:DNA-directed RNA polymerase specialized sigma24 family protein
MNVVTESTVKIDAVLEPLLLAGNDDNVDEFLLRLITGHTERVIKGIIRYKLHLTWPQQTEADDIYHEVLVQLLTELQQLRNGPDEHPISDVRGMAAVIAHRTCSSWMRRQFPERHALKNRLHYLLTRQRGMALWRDEDGMLVAGFTLWQGRKAAPTARLRRLSADEGLVAHLRTVKNGRPQEMSEALTRVFNHLGSPVEFDELVSVLAALLGIRDLAIESIDDDENGISLRAASGEPDPAWKVEKRLFLQRLWEELLQLPLNQRASLLLNLKDVEGRGCIALFPATGIATIRQLAEALEMNPDCFAELWNELPIEDARIAELLQLTRQQVINARKSGRERLARRLKGFF